MAVDMFIKIGDLKGESQDQKHKDEIDVLSWTWGVSNMGSAHVGGGAGTGKANVQDLSFTKWMDKASTPLLLACCSGKHFQEASLVICKAGEKPLEYCKIKMERHLQNCVGRRCEIQRNQVSVHGKVWVREPSGKCVLMPNSTDFFKDIEIKAPDSLIPSVGASVAGGPLIRVK